MRIIAVFEKGDRARFTSHLDMQRAIQRALRRAEIPVKYSKGFNPHPLISFASALSLGYTSKCECVDVCAEEISESDFFAAMAQVMPPALALAGAHAVDDAYPALTAVLKEARYRLLIPLGEMRGEPELRAALDALMESPVIAEKKGKGGVAMLDIRPMVLGLGLESVDSDLAAVELAVECTAKGALNPSLLIPHIQAAWRTGGDVGVCRTALLAGGKRALWEAV